jgi:hypothetical protein
MKNGSTGSAAFIQMKTESGLPDGFFLDQKSKFGNILEDIVMDIVVIFSGHLEYFTTIGYMLWAFGNSSNFSPGFVYCTKENLATLTEPKFGGKKLQEESSDPPF